MDLILLENVFVKIFSKHQFVQGRFRILIIIGNDGQDLKFWLFSLTLAQSGWEKRVITAALLILCKSEFLLRFDIIEK